MSNGGSPHNQTIREKPQKPSESKEVTHPKGEKQAAPQSGPTEQNKAGSQAGTARA